MHTVTYIWTVLMVVGKWESFISLIVSCTNITIDPSNLSVILFVGMHVYSNLSKFQSDDNYKS